MRYIAVLHLFFVRDGYFKVEELSATNAEDARKEAIILEHSKDTTFQHCKHRVIEISDNERITEKLNRIPLWIRKFFNAS